MPMNTGYENVMSAPMEMSQEAVMAATNNATNGVDPNGVDGEVSDIDVGSDMFNTGFFKKGGMAQTGLGAIKTLGSLWNSFQQNKIARKSQAFQEKTFGINLENQTKTYNTELEDRIRNRYDTERRDPGEADKYIEKNRL
jgi:hypothetical protein